MQTAVITNQKWRQSRKTLRHQYIPMQRIWVVIRRHNMISLHFPPLMFSLCSQPHSFCLAPLCHPVLMENSQTVKLCPPSALVDRKALVIMDWSYDGNGGGGVETRDLPHIQISVTSASATVMSRAWSRATFAVFGSRFSGAWTTVRIYSDIY